MSSIDYTQNHALTIHGLHHNRASTDVVENGKVVEGKYSYTKDNELKTSRESFHVTADCYHDGRL